MLREYEVPLLALLRCGYRSDLIDDERYLGKPAKAEEQNGFFLALAAEAKSRRFLG